MVIATLKRYLRLETAFAAAIVAIASLGSAEAQRVPDGIEFGPWIIAPSLSTSYEADNNIFLDSEANAENDRVIAYRGDVRALLPFRNSHLKLEYSATKEDFSNNEFPRDLTEVADFELELNFRSGDRLRFGDTFRKDFARSEEIDAGGELTFNGEPYSINRWDIKLSRTDPSHQGYVVHVRRFDFTYDGLVDIGFFEYRGFDNTFEYRQPLPGSRSWLLRYDTRRFNHYDPEGEVGTPFRKEKSDTAQFGLRGFFGDDQPYRIHLGFGRLDYLGDESSGFEGIVGSAAWRLRLGGRTRLELEAVRRTLPSNFESYYINNAIRAELKRKWLRFEAGTELRLTKNNYADEIADLECDGRRKDITYQAGINAAWHLHERIKIKASAFFNERSSSCDFADYTASGIKTGLTMGWF